MDSSIAIWNTNNSKCICVFEQISTQAILDLCWSRDGHILMASTNAGDILCVRFGVYAFDDGIIQLSVEQHIQYILSQYPSLNWEDIENIRGSLTVITGSCFTKEHQINVDEKRERMKKLRVEEERIKAEVAKNLNIIEIKRSVTHNENTDVIEGKINDMNVAMVDASVVNNDIEIQEIVDDQNTNVTNNAGIDDDNDICIILENKNEEKEIIDEDIIILDDENEQETEINNTEIDILDNIQVIEHQPQSNILKNNGKEENIEIEDEMSDISEVYTVDEHSFYPCLVYLCCTCMYICIVL